VGAPRSSRDRAIVIGAASAVLRVVPEALRVVFRLLLRRLIEWGGGSGNEIVCDDTARRSLALSKAFLKSQTFFIVGACMQNPSKCAQPPTKSLPQGGACAMLAAVAA
jgi:hypothetical protein